MFPWPYLWLWAPQWHFPWSGNFAQRIDPDTHWFFAGIRPGAGDARIEERAFGVASYGRQLGLLADVVIDLAQRSAPHSAEAVRALRELQDIATRIERIKDDEHAATAVQLEAQLRELQRRGGAAWEQLAARLQPLVAPRGIER